MFHQEMFTYCKQVKRMKKVIVSLSVAVVMAFVFRPGYAEPGDEEALTNQDIVETYRGAASRRGHRGQDCLLEDRL